MSQKNYNTKKKYNHLSDIERGKIEAYLGEGKNISEIARLLNRHRSTIKRELDRNSVQQVKNISGYDKEVKIYYAETGAILYEKRRKNSIRKPLKGYSENFFNELIKAITTKPRVHSIETFIEVYKRNNPSEIIPCFKTIYRYIHKGILGVKPIDLPRMVRFRMKKDGKSRNKKHARLYGKSIEERPKDVEERKEVGHWEIDTVIGKKGKNEPVLLTIVERKTRYMIVAKLKDKTNLKVNRAIENILTEYCTGTFKSITADNGTEFSKLCILDNNNLNIYYAHPYSSYERGTNEVHNSLIREYLPKGISFNSVSDEYLLKIVKAINNRPRKMFNYYSPEEMFKNEISLL